MKERQPWDRREKETPKAYSAFLCYRDMRPGDRSQLGAYALYAGPSKSEKVRHPSPSFKRWFKDHEWEERAYEYDMYAHSEARRRYGMEAARRYTARLEQIDEVRDKVIGWIKGVDFNRIPGRTQGVFTLLSTCLTEERSILSNMLQMLPPEEESRELVVPEYVYDDPWLEKEEGGRQ